MTFWERFTTCLPWPGAVNSHGPVLKFRGKVTNARRVSWMLTHGPIPPDHDVVNTCGNPLCCAPAHLWLRPPKLTAADVREIRTSPDAPGRLATRFGVCRQTIIRIRERRLHKGVKYIE